MNIKSNKNVLNIDGKKFGYKIKDILTISDLTILLLEIPINDDTIDNIFALNSDGEVVWRVESLHLLYPEKINLPYEYITLEGNVLRATDFYGRRYSIHWQTGKVTGRDIVK